MSISAALKKARKIIKERESINSEKKNVCIVTKEFNSQPEGALVIILHSE